jgi:hypothetical protein
MFIHHIELRSSILNHPRSLARDDRTAHPNRQDDQRGLRVGRPTSGLLNRRLWRLGRVVPYTGEQAEGCVAFMQHSLWRNRTRAQFWNGSGASEPAEAATILSARQLPLRSEARESAPTLSNQVIGSAEKTTSR